MGLEVDSFADFRFSDSKSCQYGIEGIRRGIPGADGGAQIRIVNHARFFSFELSSAASCRAASVAALAMWMPKNRSSVSL